MWCLALDPVCRGTKFAARVEQLEQQREELMCCWLVRCRRIRIRALFAAQCGNSKGRAKMRISIDRKLLNVKCRAWLILRVIVLFSLSGRWYHERSLTGNERG